jgi:hypothetical protein
MTFIPFLALFLIIVALVGVVAYGIAVIRKAKKETDKKFLSLFFLIVLILFMAGGITRTIQQSQGFEWLDGFVTIFAGLIVLLWGVPFFRRINRNKSKRNKKLLFFVPGLLFSLLGIGIIYIGINQVIQAFR